MLLKRFFVLFIYKLFFDWHTTFLAMHFKKQLYRILVALGGGIIFGLLVCFGINIWIVSSAKWFVFSSVDFLDKEVSSVDAVIILWAKVYSDGRLSWAVQERADQAIALRKAGKAKKILVSGDNRTRYYDEVTTIKKYLFNHDIPAEAVFLDFAWLDTYDSAYRAQHIFQIKSLLIPTQAFHVDRAVFLARKLGIDAYGISTDSPSQTPLQMVYIREFFARWKAWWDVMMKSLPRHLGEPIPISGVSNSE